MKRKPLLRPHNEQNKKPNGNLQKLPQKLRRRRLKLLLRRLKRRVILMMTGRKQRPNPRMMSKIAGMLILKKKERRLLPKRPMSQMANQSRQFCPHEIKKLRSLSLSQNRMNHHQKMKKYLRPRQQQP
jgi:hypothetical protein